MALPIDSCQYVPFVPYWKPTIEVESHSRTRICGDVEALHIITNRKPIRVYRWALCAELVVVYPWRSVGDSLSVKPSEQDGRANRNEKRIAVRHYK